MSYELNFDPVDIVPTFQYTHDGPDNIDGGLNNRYFYLGFPIKFTLFGPVDFIGGPGVLFFRQSGNGGVVVLNNGNSTANFNLPDSNRLSKYWALEGGLIFRVLRNFKIDTRVLISGFLSGRRSFSIAAAGHLGIF